MTVFVETVLEPGLRAVLSDWRCTPKVPQDKWERRFGSSRSCGARCAGLQGRAREQHLHAQGRHTQALPRGHELFIETSALGQRPRRLS